MNSQLHSSPPANSVTSAPMMVMDPALPQLGFLLDREVMSAALSDQVYRQSVRATRISLVRHKPGRRCILRYDLQVGIDGERHETVYGKTFASERGPAVYEVTRAITLARACGPKVVLPNPLAYLPDLKVLLQRRVPGLPVGAALLEGDTCAATAIAEALFALHSSGLSLRKQHVPGKEFGPLRDRVDRLIETCPGLARPAHRCLSLIERHAERIEGWRWRPVHRDFYHEQVLIHEGGLSVLDFDDAAMSEPAVDVANFRAHLRLLALQTKGDALATAEAAIAFGRRYAALDAELQPGLVRFLEGATLLRLAEIHLPRHRGGWLASRLLGTSEFLLEGEIDQ